MNTRETKVCLSCAETGKLKWLPCANHSQPVDPTTCPHELTSFIFTHNSEDDGYKCHTCGTIIKDDLANA